MRQTFPLHFHWDGSIPAQYLFELAKERGKTLYYPESDIHGNPITVATENDRTISSAQALERFFNNLRNYAIPDVFGIPVGFMQTREDLHRNATNLCRYMRSQNSPYGEIRFAPQYHVYEGLTMDQVIGHAVEGFQQGKEETGFDGRLIISIGREVSPEQGLEVAKAAIRLNRTFPGHVLGIDLACEETTNPPEKHLPAYQATFDTPLKRTVHAGEMYLTVDENLKAIRTAVFALRADGVGHAIPLWQDADLMRVFIEREIRHESNPVSNEFFFGRKIHEDLRLDRLLDAGVLTTINPDDPAMIKSGTMEDNMNRIAVLYGERYVTRAIENSIRAAWGLSEEEKIRYLMQHDE